MTTIILTGRAGKSVLLNELKKIYSDDDVIVFPKIFTTRFNELACYHAGL